MTTITALRIQRDRVALEGNFISSGMENIKDLVRSFGDFTNITSGFNIGTSGGSIALSSGHRDFLREIEKHNYRDMQMLTAYVPEGMDVEYGAYAGVLTDSVEHCSENTMQILTTLGTYISNLITNDKSLVDTHVFVNKLSEHERTRDTQNAHVGKCFGKGSTTAARKIGDVISRNADWKGLFEQVTYLDQTIDSIDKGKLHKKMKDVNDLLEVFKKKYDNGAITEISPEVTQNLSGLLYQTACELEFFSVTFYRVLALNTSINRTMEYVRTVFKQ